MPRGRSVRTPEKRKRFFDGFRKAGTVTGACKAAGISRSIAYEWRDKDPAFAEEWQTVEDESTDALEKEAYRRAKNGSDTLLIFLLKGRKPETYRDRYEVKGDHTATVEVLIRYVKQGDKSENEADRA